MLRNAAIPFVPEAAHLELVIIGRATLAKHAARDIIIGRLAPGLIADLAFLDRLDIVGGRKAAWAEEFGEVEERSEEHTSELQSLMRISYAVFCLKKKKIKKR